MPENFAPETAVRLLYAIAVTLGTSEVSAQAPARGTPSALDDDEAQIEWLEQDLRASAASCGLAYWHHPAYTSGLRRLLPWNPGYQARVAWERLYGHDAEILVNGHEHFYERFLPMSDDGVVVDGGIRQCTAGTGGGELHTRSLPHKNRARHLSGHGVLVLILSRGSYEFRFVGIDGVVHDTSDGPTRCR